MSGRYSTTETSALNKHVDVGNWFNWDGGSTPPASTIFASLIDGREVFSYVLSFENDPE